MGGLRCARTYHLDETRDRLKVRAYGDRALIVLVRVTPHQGGRESRLQGEAAQVETALWGRARDVRILNRRNVSTGKPDDTETVLSGLGRGRWNRASNGTSPAAYFIALPQIYRLLSIPTLFNAVLYLVLVSRDRRARDKIQDVLGDFLALLLLEEMTSFLNSDVGLFFR